MRVRLLIDTLLPEDQIPGLQGVIQEQPIINLTTDRGVWFPSAGRLVGAVPVNNEEGE